MGAQTGPGRLPEAHAYVACFFAPFWSVLGSILGPHWDPFGLQFSNFLHMCVHIIFQSAPGSNFHRFWYHFGFHFGAMFDTFFRPLDLVKN